MWGKRALGDTRTVIPSIYGITRARAGTRAQGGRPTREAAACPRPATPGEAAPAGRAPAPTPQRRTTGAIWPAPVGATAGAGSGRQTTGDAPMQDDIRAAAAQYYDANPTVPDDLAFYMA